jgi:hypothetical protein
MVGGIEGGKVFRSGLRSPLLKISGALDLDVFKQPVSRDFFSNLLFSKLSKGSLSLLSFC